MSVSPEKAILAHDDWDKCEKTQCFSYHKALIHIYVSSPTYQIAYFLHCIGGPWDQRTLSLAGKFMKTRMPNSLRRTVFHGGHSEINALLLCFLSILIQSTDCEVKYNQMIELKSTKFAFKLCKTCSSIYVQVCMCIYTYT